MATVNGILALSAVSVTDDRTRLLRLKKTATYIKSLGMEGAGTRSRFYCRPAAYVKGWRHVAKGLAEMRRLEKATTNLKRGLSLERKTAECGKGLRVSLLYGS